ncbi:MAG: hypothetical protein ACK2UV_04680 [Candidatus Promineifilaceae bacterium]
MNQAQQLAHYIQSLPDFEILKDPAVANDHMGAVLAEAALQGGIRYETVVRPRVEALLAAYPGAKTTSEFQRILMIEGAAALLKWRPDRKIETLVDLTRFFVAEGVETVDELRAWLLDAANMPRLRGIKGIGPKTADYLKSLAGISTSMVDVHIYRFLALAGVEVKGYDDAQEVIRATAVLLNTRAGSSRSIDERTLDYSIWTYMAG